MTTKIITEGYVREDGAKALFLKGKHRGWLMPEVTNHIVEQPKSLAEKLVLKRIAERAA